jgi:hypothetical protein
MFVIVSSLAFVMPNATALALADHPAVAGTSAASSRSDRTRRGRRGERRRPQNRPFTRRPTARASSSRVGYALPQRDGDGGRPWSSLRELLMTRADCMSQAVSR